MIILMIMRVTITITSSSTITIYHNDSDYIMMVIYQAIIEYQLIINDNHIRLSF